MFNSKRLAKTIKNSELRIKNEIRSTKFAVPEDRQEEPKLETIKNAMPDGRQEELRVEEQESGSLNPRLPSGTVESSEVFHPDAIQPDDNDATPNSDLQSSISDLTEVQPIALSTEPESTSSQLPASNSDLNDELKDLREKVDNAHLPTDLKHRADSMIVRLSKMNNDGNYSKEYEPVSEYVNWITKIPWGKKTTDNLELESVRNELVRHHYGLEPVKQRLMEYLAIMKLRTTETEAPEGQEMSSQMSRLQGSSSHAPVLCFVGIQGVGKTSIAKSISNALNRKFIRIALGATGSVTEIRGRSRGEIDAEPGQIVKALIRSESMNPVILLDEIDKTSSSTGLRADVMAALLEILDPEQNSTFIDKYIDFPIDLSGVFFITTANNLGGISAALLDRLEIIRFGSYSDKDKVQIAKNYLLPKVRKATGLTENQLSFEDDVWELVVRPLGFDAGVRQLERTLEELARKVALQIVQGTATGVRLNKENFRQYIPEDFGVYS